MNGGLREPNEASRHAPGDRAVAVGERGTILTSVDTANWSRATPQTSHALFEVASGADLWVCVGEQGTVLTSVDGWAWTKRGSGTSATLRAVAYGNELFVAAGDQGTVILSLDGTNWMRNVYSPQEQHLAAAYGNGRFLLVGGGTFQIDLRRGILAEPQLFNNQARFSLIGEIAQKYLIQSSPSLLQSDWTSLAVVTNIHLVTPLAFPATTASEGYYVVEATR